MRLIRLREASHLYGIALETLYRAARAAPDNPMHLPHVRMGPGGAILTRPEWVEEWLERVRSDAGRIRRMRSVQEGQAYLKALERMAERGGAA